uniref:Uncharacterized protein n=1 Tax=Rhizophora mucronata TaxID=61149 RepID=A0A2P2IK35_RHIMU
MLQTTHFPTKVIWPSVSFITKKIMIYKTEVQRKTATGSLENFRWEQIKRNICIFFIIPI